MDRAKNVCRFADVLDDQLVIDVIARLVLRCQLPQLRVVVFAAADCFLENRGVRCHPAEIVFIDHLFQLAGGHQPALHLVVPDALSDFGQFSEWVGHGDPPLQPRSISLTLAMVVTRRRHRRA